VENVIVGWNLFVWRAFNECDCYHLDAVLIMICQIIKLFFGTANYCLFLEISMIFWRETVKSVIYT
jgi:hypothetical protein